MTAMNCLYLSRYQDLSEGKMLMFDNWSQARILFPSELTNHFAQKPLMELRPQKNLIEQLTNPHHHHFQMS